MKSFSSRTVQDLEVLQLLILDEIFALPVSRQLLFQGGTCLRWAYSGTRYSEDLDFLGPDIGSKDVTEMRGILESRLGKRCVVQFGPGLLEVSGGEKSRGQLHTLWVKYRREGHRNKIAVKIEIQQAHWSEAKRAVLRQLPEVSRFLVEATIRIPFGRSIIQCAPVQEILAEKIKALVERTYLKGRDLYDIWFITQTLQVAAPPSLVVERTNAYPGQFVARRSLGIFLKDSFRQELIGALKELHRFIPPEELHVTEREKYSEIILAVHETVEELLEKGLGEKIVG